MPSWRSGRLNRFFYILYTSSRARICVVAGQYRRSLFGGYFSFFVNRSVTFKVFDRVSGRFFRFATVAAAGLAASNALVYVLTVLNMPDTFAKLTLAIVLLICDSAFIRRPQRMLSTRLRRHCYRLSRPALPDHAALKPRKSASSPENY